MPFDPQEVSAPGAKIKVFGVGGGGTNAVSTMIRSNLEGVDFISANTDIQSLRFALAPSKIQIGKELTKGLGAGSDPDIGRDAALEDRHEIQEQLSGADMVFITAGMGGGTGTGGASIVSQIARECGALTVGVVTKPFSFEGKRRRKHAEIGIERLKEHVDTLIVIPNDRLLKVATPNLSMLDAFKLADNILVNAVRGISDIINIPGTVNVDFADVKTIMSSMGHALMGIGIASGENRASEAAKQAISSPLLEDVDIEGATGILINISAGEAVSLMEINDACSIIEEAAHEDANIIFGAVIDETMKEEIRITVIATGFPTQDEKEYQVQHTRKIPLAQPHSYYEKERHRKFHQQTTPKPSFKEGLMADALSRETSSYDKPTKPSDVLTSRLSQDEHLKSFATKQEPHEIHESELTHWTMNQSHNNSIDEKKEIEEVTNKSETDFVQPAKTKSLEEDFVQSSLLDDHNKKSAESQIVQKPSILEGGRIDRSAQDLFFDHHKLNEDIDKRIDEALELAERVSSLDRSEDDIDIPTFLRQNKDINLP